MCWHIKPRKGLPKKPEYNTWLEGGMKISPNKLFTSRYQHTYDLDWTDGQYVAYGRVDYKDVFGDFHVGRLLVDHHKKV